MGYQATTLIPGFTFVEGPRWHDGRIWFSDLYTYRVLSAAEDGSDVREEAMVPQQPSGLGWLPDGRLLVVSMFDRKILRRELDGTLVTHADLARHATGCLGDLVVDGEGRAYVGNFGFDIYQGESLKPAALHRVDPDGSVVEVANDLWFPNGAVLTPDGVLVVNETFGNRITAFEVGEDGGLTNRRLWAEFGPLPGEVPVEEAMRQISVASDGASLDRDGGLWIADIKNGRLLRVLDGGVVTDEVRPEICPFACALGGQSGTTLYVCASPDYDEEARKTSREAAVLAVTVHVPAA